MNTWQQIYEYPDGKKQYELVADNYTLFIIELSTIVRWSVRIRGFIETVNYCKTTDLAKQTAENWITENIYKYFPTIPNI